jgi:hypothetical protein
MSGASSPERRRVRLALAVYGGLDFIISKWASRILAAGH